jgi:hypothetical protein
MEDFISFILGIASEEFIRPVYSVVPAGSMEERIATGLDGYRNNAPVRIGNAAAGQVQHDTYGSIILAAMPMFFDRRLPRPGDAGLFNLLETLGVEAARLAFEPEAGIWEYRGRTRVPPFGGDVLGRLQPAPRHRIASRHGRACRALDRHGEQDAGTLDRRGLERKTRHFHGRIRD